MKFCVYVKHEMYNNITHIILKLNVSTASPIKIIYISEQ